METESGILKIFVSSPGDVSEERLIAERVINRLVPYFLARGVELRPMFWEYEPVSFNADFCAQIPRPSSFDLFVCILWSRMGTPPHSRWVEIEGRNFRSGTEFEIIDAVESFEKIHSPVIDMWINRTDPVIPPKPPEVRDERIRQYDMLQDFLRSWTTDTSEGSLVRAFNDYTRLDTFEELFEKKLRARIEDLRKLGTARRTAAIWKGSPYRGLYPYHPRHADIFHGRTRAIGEVAKILKARHLVSLSTASLIEGPSGSGKSSLALAGLVPFLTSAGIVEGFSNWRVAYLRPTGGSDLIGATAKALCSAGPEGLEEERPEDRAALPELLHGDKTSDDFADQIRADRSQAIGLFEGALNLVSAVANLERKHQLERLRDQRREQGRTADVEAIEEILVKIQPLRTGFVLVLDQLEELLTGGIPKTDAEDFLGFINRLAATRHVFVIGTARSDFLRPLRTTFSNWSETFPAECVYTLDPPSNPELGQIISRPAIAAGLRFEHDDGRDESLDVAIRDAAVAHRDALPMVQFALHRLYEELGEADDILTYKVYQEIGGIEGAIARYADDVVGKLLPEVAAAFDPVFRKLVTIKLDDEKAVNSAPLAEPPVTSRAAPWEDLIGPEDAPDPLKTAFVNAMVEARLLTTEVDHDGNRQVRIAHDSLVNHWETLKQRTAIWREFLERRAVVQQSHSQWRRSGKRNGFLLAGGAPLRSGLDLLKHHRSDLSEDLAGYIETSRSRRRLFLGAVGIPAVVALAVVTYSLWSGWRDRETDLLVSDLQEQFELAIYGDYPDPHVIREIVLRLFELDPKSGKNYHRIYAEALVALGNDEELKAFVNQVSPKSPPVYLRLIQAARLLDQGEIGPAVELYEAVLDGENTSREESAEALHGLAEGRKQRKEWKELERLSMRLIEIAPSTEAYLAKAEAELMLRKWESSLISVQAALAREPGNSEAEEMQTRIQELLDAAQELGALDKAIQKNSGDFAARARRGWMLLRAGFPELADVDLKVAHETLPDSISAALGKAICELGFDPSYSDSSRTRTDGLALFPIYRDEVREWIQDRREPIEVLIGIEAGEFEGDASGTSIDRAEAIYQIDQFELAIPAFDELLASGELAPAVRGELAFMRGFSLFRLNRYQEIRAGIDPEIDSLAPAEGSSPDPLQLDAYANLLVLRGFSTINTGEMKEALEDFEVALSIVPDHQDALDGRRQARQNLGLPETDANDEPSPVGNPEESSN